MNNNRIEELTIQIKIMEMEIIELRQKTSLLENKKSNLRREKFMLQCNDGTYELIMNNKPKTFDDNEIDETFDD